VTARTEDARRAAEEAIGVREVMDDVVRDESVDARVGVRQLLRVHDTARPGPRLGVGQLEVARVQKELAETSAAPDLDRVRLRSEIALHPVEAFAEQEAQVRARTLLVFLARALRITGVADEHGLTVVVVSHGKTPARRDSTRTVQAGSRPHTMRVTPMIASAAAVDHAIAETSGASKSVPDCAAWKKIATNAM